MADRQETNTVSYYFEGKEDDDVFEKQIRDALVKL